MATRAISLLLVCGFVLAACGGGEGDGDRDDDAAIEKAIVAFVGSDDPADCWKFTTRRLLEKLSKTNYEMALASCEALAVNPLLDYMKKATVTEIEIEVDGGTATAIASFVGGFVDGQTLRLGLVEREGRWMNDEIFGFVDLDEEKLATEWGRLLLLLSASPQEAESMTCVMNRLLELSEEDLEAMYLGSDPDSYLQLIQSCTSRSNAL
jgi:hypothetical protein